MRRLAFLLLLAALPAAAAEPGGFVWANDAQSAKYTPDANYAYNSAGGAITIYHRGVGTYAVVFAGLGRGVQGGGNVQVTQYGGGRETCGVLRWSGGDDFTVHVRCASLATGEPMDTQYTVLVTLTPALRLKVLPANGSAPPTQRPVKTINAAGNTVTTYPDGRVVERFDDGSTQTTFPDGTQMRTALHTGAPVAQPPQAPRPDEAAWLQWHSDQLLEVMKTLVKDEQAVSNYVKAEPANLTIYARIARRRDTVRFLVVE